MGRSIGSLRRVIALLKLPKHQTPLLITRASSIVSSMTGNAFFPAPEPSLATVTAAIEALTVAETATLSRAKGTVEVRNEKRVVLVSLLEALCGHVQKIADGDPEQAGSIIETAGMFVKRARTVYARVFRARPGLSGQVLLEVPSTGVSYEWQYSLDGGVTWLDLPPTKQAHTTVKGLKPGMTVFFRYRAVTKEGPTDWSQRISIIVS
jgi:hypothetical protein